MTLHSIVLLRMVYLDKKQSFFPTEIKGSIEECILDFKYWWDDGRRDTTYRCYHTENHQALYHTAELLAGQLYKKTEFTNGMNGKQHMAHAKERLMKWLEYRFRFGFSEWMSTYCEVEVLLLANLYDFAEDKDIRSKAGMVLDLLMFDVALNNYEGFLWLGKRTQLCPFYHYGSPQYGSIGQVGIRRGNL